MENNALSASAPVKSTAATARKARGRKNRKVKIQAAKGKLPFLLSHFLLSSLLTLNAALTGNRVRLQHRQKNNAGRRWLFAQVGQPGSNGISDASRKRLVSFWSRPHAGLQMVTELSEEGEQRPDMDDETLAHWRRFEEAWSAGEIEKKGRKKRKGKGKKQERAEVVDDLEGEEEDGEGGVKIEAEEEDDDTMDDLLGPPEPVSEDEYEDDIEL